MGSSWSIGLAAGLAASAVSAFGTVRGGDPHLVSTAPDLLSAVLITGFVVLAVRRATTAAGPAAARHAGLETTLTASAVCGVLMALFTLWYLPVHALSLAAFGGGVSFVLVYAVGYLATVLGLRSYEPLRPSTR